MTVLDFENAAAQTVVIELREKELVRCEESYLPQECENLLGRVMAGLLKTCICQIV